VGRTTAPGLSGSAASVGSEQPPGTLTGRLRRVAERYPGRVCVALVLAAFGIRMCAAPLILPQGWALGDVFTFEWWAVQLASHPLREFYSAGATSFRSGGHVTRFAPDHLPGDLWLLWLVAQIHHLDPSASPMGGRLFLVLVKLVPSLADAGIGWMLYIIGRRYLHGWRTLLPPVLFLFNPAVIYVSAFWGQWDSVSAFVVIVAIWLALRGNPEWAFPVLTYAVLIKPQFLAVIPLLLVAFTRSLRSKSTAGTTSGFRTLPAIRAPGALRPVLTAAGSSLFVLYAVILPFGVGLWPFSQRWTLAQRFQVAWNLQPFIDKWAFNIWATPLSPHGGLSIGRLTASDQAPFFLGQSYQRWGELLLGAAIALAVLVYARVNGELSLLWAGLCITLSLFTLLTRVHERYVFPAVMLAALIAPIIPRLRPAYLLLSVTFMLNLLFVFEAPVLSSRLPLYYGSAVVGNFYVYVWSVTNCLVLLYVLAVPALRSLSPATSAPHESP
jgi:dolichyl-phosphate-mannose-protein mannosyltransferase